jgi:predicted short-subunit dehydrogenase-like oxidoreductase (DUF2520 family)
MRELERDLPSILTARMRLAIVGRGRLGSALSEALRGSDRFEIVGPLGRGADASGADAVLLCVPDAQIIAAADGIVPGVPVGHCSGATPLEALAPRERFGFHPLMTVPATGAQFAGAGAAIAGSTERARALAEALATALEMHPVAIADADRSAYHAAASVASNFLVTLEAAAEQLAASAGVDRSLLVPLVRATVENWAELGAKRALTGPVARGDELTVARQREAVAERAPAQLELFDALVAATRQLATGPGREACAA